MATETAPLAPHSRTENVFPPRFSQNSGWNLNGGFGGRFGDHFGAPKYAALPNPFQKGCENMNRLLSILGPFWGEVRGMSGVGRLARQAWGFNRCDTSHAKRVFGKQGFRTLP